MIEKSGKLKRYRLSSRKSKVSVRDLIIPYEAGDSLKAFLEKLPSQLAAVELKEASIRIAEARKKRKQVIVGFGGHVIKVGLGPLLVDMMKRGVITALCTNGAGMIHDFELALAGKTSEDVDTAIVDGSFGFAEETGKIINEAVKKGTEKGWGIGEAVGKVLESKKAKYRNISVLVGAGRNNVPLTVHVAIGTDIVHMHEDADGEAWGKSAFVDFRKFCDIVSELEGGVYLNIGSAVVLPEVFLKAVTRARNAGKSLRRITTIDMDFIKQYRPQTNVIRRPTSEGGRGISLVGHHEIMVPLLFASVIEEMR